MAGLPAAGRARNLIAGTIAQLPLRDTAPDGTLWGPRPILDDPWPMMGVAEWVTYQVVNLLMFGDAIAIPADFDPDGFPRQLIPLDPRLVDVRWSDDGRSVLYNVLTPGGVMTLTRSDVWHAKGLTLTSDGLRGVGVVAQYRLALSTDVALQAYGGNVFGAGVPSGIVKVHLREVSEKQANDVKAQWLTAFRDRVPAVLGELMDFTPIQWSPADAEYLDAARFSVAQIAFMFNLDPMDLDTSLGASMTYANREQRAYDRLLTSIGPILVRLEQAYRFVMPRGHVPVFDRSIVLWSDASTRANVQDTRLANGSLTLNEVRSSEGRPKYGAWADVPFAGDPNLPTPPPPALPPAPPPEGGPQNA